MQSALMRLGEAFETVLLSGRSGNLIAPCLLDDSFPYLEFHFLRDSPIIGRFRKLSFPYKRGSQKVPGNVVSTVMVGHMTTLT